MRKRALALLIGLVLLLSACGQKPGNTATGAAQDSTTQETATSEAAAVGTQTGDLWAPREAPAVRNEIPEEEQRLREQAILDAGTLLFSGSTDAGYYPADISWLTGAQKGDAIAIRYRCDDESHGGWGVLGLAVNKGPKRVQQDLPAGTIPSQERLTLYTVEELMAMVGCESPADFSGFSLGAWNGGHILGLYYLPQEQTQALRSYWAQVAETEQIIHTYTGELSNPNAMENAKTLYAYLQEVYGTGCLTGQMESTWMDSPDYEMDYIHGASGRYPAIRGLDFMGNDFDGVVQRSLDWWEKGGIVTICWHTGAGFDSGYEESLVDNIDWEEAFLPGSDTYNALIAGMDRAVPALQTLEDAGVPVLWRPFHELNGGWFWWSKGGADNFVKLWQLMYSRYTDFWGLDNLIWVYGYSGSGGMADWYPGDSYVDLVGADSYTAGANGSLYTDCTAVSPEGMPIVFHECGMVPSEAEMREAGAKWLWFMVWHTEWLTDSRKGNTPEYLNEIYNSDYFITLDELPELK